MALWTPEKLQKVREIIARHHAAIAIACFGVESLPPDLLKDLRAAGVEVPKGPKLIDDAFAYGKLAALLRDPKLATKSPTEIADLVIARKLDLQLSPAEKAAVSVAKQHAGQYVVGLGTRVAGQVMAVVTGAEANLTPARMVEIIQDKTARNIEQRKTIDSLRSDFGHAMGNWTRDWQRIAMTESNNAIQEGTASALEERHGADVRVSKMPRGTACPDCKRLYLGSDGNPKVFTLAELRANGSNVGKPKSAWRATVEAIHPWCFPAGTFVLTSRGEIPIEDVQLGDVVFTHNGRWRAVHRLYRRAYDGKLIELGYGDKKLRTTPSHPIASGGGWISAEDIQEGAHLLHAPREVVFAEADHPPTQRREKRRFAHVLQGLLCGRVPVAAIYFNGDLLIGVRDVDQESSDLIVRLRDAPELRSKDLEEQGFELRSDPTGLGGDLSQYFFFGADAPTPRAVGSGGAVASAVWADAIHFDLGRFARGALDAAGLANSEDNGAARATELFSNGLYAHVLIEVHAADDERIETVTDSAHREHVASACVDVTSRTSAPFKGTVYNLGVVEDESYAANGVIVHNCGCVLVRLPEGMEWEDGELVAEKVKKSETLSKARKARTAWKEPIALVIDMSLHRGTGVAVDAGRDLITPTSEVATRPPVQISKSYGACAKCGAQSQTNEDGTAGVCMACRLAKGGLDLCPRCGALARLSDSDGAEPCWACLKALEAAGEPYKRAGWDYVNDRWLGKADGASEALSQVSMSPQRLPMMSWRGNEDSPKPQRPADIVGANEAMGLTVSSKKKRRKAKAEAEAIARQSRMTPADRFAPAKRMEREPKDTQHFVPDIVEDAREGARDGREAKRERIHADLERRIANKPPTDPVRIARARGES